MWEFQKQYEIKNTPYEIRYDYCIINTPSKSTYIVSKNEIKTK